MSLSSGSLLGSHAAWPGGTLTSRARSAASAGRGDLGADQVTMAVRFPPVGRQVSSDLRVGILSPLSASQLRKKLDRRVYVYQPPDLETCLDDPASVSGDPVLPGFVLEPRRLWD